MNTSELKFIAPCRASAGRPRRPVAQEVELQGRSLARGVWMAPYTVSGCSLLIAVTSRGDLLAETILTPDKDQQQATDQLEDLLDLVDAPSARPGLVVLT